MTLSRMLDGMARILNEGSSTTSYKWLLTWSILDSAPLNLAHRGNEELHLRHVAESATRVMAPQRRPFEPLGKPLKQGSLKDDPLLFREERSLIDVSWALAQWPLPRLQRVSGGVVQVLWIQQSAWESQLEKDRNSRIPRRLFATDEAGFPTIPLIDGALESLIRLSPLIKPLVEIRWRDDVRTWNRQAAGLDESWSVDEYLFPDSTRHPLPQSVHRALAQIQNDCCFWCESPLKGRVRHADHVLPWSRTLNDNVENLVISDSHCNSVKSDRLISPMLGRKWSAHIRLHRESFRRLAESHNLQSAPDESVAWLLGLTRTSSGEVDYFDVVNGQPLIRRARASAIWPVDSSWLGAEFA